MLVTPENNRRNRNHAFAIAGATAVAAAVAGWFWPPVLLSLGLCPVLYWLVRRRCLRRLKIMKQPFPASWEQILQSHVAFFRALSDPKKERFRQLVMVFLDEVRITGIRTELDDTVRVLVAASAAIPIFGFHDWEYHRLGEVLVYPNSFGEDYQAAGNADKHILGMVGLQHLRGVMILSKPSLLAGFDIPSSKDNVGIHEFTHLVEQEEIEHGLPPEIPWQAVKHWVHYVKRELSHPSRNRSYINSYAYTNEHEFLAVLAEYFFKSPDCAAEQGSAIVRDAPGDVPPGHRIPAETDVFAAPEIRSKRPLSVRKRQEVQALLSAEGDGNEQDECGCRDGPRRWLTQKGELNRDDKNSFPRIARTNGRLLARRQLSVRGPDLSWEHLVFVGVTRHLSVGMQRLWLSELANASTCSKSATTTFVRRDPHARRCPHPSIAS